MAASLATLPNTRPVFVQRLDPDRRAILLAWLAAETLEYPERLPAAAQRVLLSAWASETLQGVALDEAWLEYLSAVRLEEDVESGLVTWQQVEPELTCPEPTEVVREMAHADAAAALRILVLGDTNGGN
jgi:hypothetical protein